MHRIAEGNTSLELEETGVLRVLPGCAEVNELVNKLPGIIVNAGG